MVDKAPFDIAMKFVLKGGGAVWGECALDVHADDPLMRDFKPISSYDDYSNFFEVLEFDFAMTVEPDDTGAGNLSRGGGGSRGILQQALPGAPHAGAGKAPAPAQQGGGDAFQRWRSASEAEARSMKFQLAFESFRFTRVIDGASPIFFQACALQQRFESAAIVKRVSTGGPKRQSLAYMRIDFKDVMLKSVKWDDGDLVKESCEFVCSKLRYQYRQQAADGSLLPVRGEAVWDRLLDAERKREGTG